MTRLKFWYSARNEAQQPRPGSHLAKLDDGSIVPYSEAAKLSIETPFLAEGYPDLEYLGTGTIHTIDGGVSFCTG